MAVLISFSKKFIFVANTKTASTSVEAALRPYADINHQKGSEQKHMPLHRICEIYNCQIGAANTTFEALFKFGIMRDPIEWITSWFRYRKGNRVESPLPDEMTFSDFWRQADWNIRHTDGRKYLQSDRFMSADGQEILADAILPYDRLKYDFVRFCHLIQIDVFLGWHNVSAIQHVEEPLCEDLLQEIRFFYEEDYKLIDRLENLNRVGFARLERICGSGNE